MRSVAVYADSEVLRAGLESVIESSDEYTVTESLARMDQLESRVATTRPDLLVADLARVDRSFIRRLLDLQTPAALLTDLPRDELLAGRAGRAGLAVLSRDAPAEAIMAGMAAAVAGLVAFEPVREPALTSSRSTPVDSSRVLAEVLTPRELEILTMLAEGLGNKTIAHRLGISDHTVKFHVGSILRKLDASSRTEAVTNGVRRGLITV